MAGKQLHFCGKGEISPPFPELSKLMGGGDSYFLGWGSPALKGTSVDSCSGVHFAFWAWDEEITKVELLLLKNAVSARHHILPYFIDAPLGECPFYEAAFQSRDGGEGSWSRRRRSYVCLPLSSLSSLFSFHDEGGEERGKSGEMSFFVKSRQGQGWGGGGSTVWSL